MRKSGADLDGFLPFDRHAAGFCAPWFPHMFGLGVFDRHLSRIPGFRMPGRNGGRLADQGGVGPVAVGMAENHVAAGLPVHMEPEVVCLGHFQAEQVVIRIRFPGERFKVAFEFIGPAIGLNVWFTHVR